MRSLKSRVTRKTLVNTPTSYCEVSLSCVVMHMEILSNKAFMNCNLALISGFCKMKRLETLLFPFHIMLILHMFLLRICLVLANNILVAIYTFGWVKHYDGNSVLPKNVAHVC